MAKRSANQSKLDPKRSTKFINEYAGFAPSSDSIDIIDINDTTTDDFYNQYVAQRKPVIINGIIPDIDIEKLKADTIIETLDSDQLLLVEKKTDGGFGSGTEREKMTFGQFMERLKRGEGLYLTTQYGEDDPDELRKLEERAIENSKNDIDDENESDEGPVNIEAIKDDHKDVDNDDDEDEVEDEAESLPPMPSGSDFSDADSIDLNNLKDDFDDSEANSPQRLDDQNIILTDFEEPLTISEATTRVAELVQRPLTSLLKSDSLPIQPTLLSKLTPQQINLWVGSSSPNTDGEFIPDLSKDDLGLGRRLFGGGVSSGLHHDHADNLYIPISGHKRFTVFCPGDAQSMYTVGTIRKVYKNGVIDYVNDDAAPGWRELREDSAIVTEVAKWTLDTDDGTLSARERDELIRLIEEEEENLRNFESKVIVNGIKKDPPSFSRVPTSIVHLSKIPKAIRPKIQEFAEMKYPNFFKAQRITIDLKPDQMLYLPASWFHEVSSFGDEENHIHIALNYWYSPPDHSSKVYKDKYWADDFKRTQESVKYCKDQE